MSAVEEPRMKIDMEAIQAPRPLKVEKAPPKAPRMETPVHGHGQLRRGGTNKGGPGRPPGSGFKQLFAEIRDDPKVHKAMRTAARNAKHPNFALANRMAEAYDEHKPKPDAAKIEVQVGVIVLPPAEDVG